MNSCSAVCAQLPPGSGTPGFSNSSSSGDIDETQHDVDLPDRTDSISSEDLQAIDQLWQSLARLRPVTTGSSITFLTFFLHGERFPTCREPRVVQLGPDVSQWASVLQEAWIDRIDQFSSLRVLIVRPSPPLDNDEEPAGHIILSQREPAFKVAIHLSVKDRSEPFDYSAVFAPIEFNRYAAILHCNLAPLCFRSTTSVHCEVSSPSGVLSTTAAVRPWPGDGFVLRIFAVVHSALAEPIEPHAPEPVDPPVVPTSVFWPDSNSSQEGQSIAINCIRFRTCRLCMISARIGAS